MCLNLNFRNESILKCWMHYQMYRSVCDGRKLILFDENFAKICTITNTKRKTCRQITNPNYWVCSMELTIGMCVGRCSLIFKLKSISLTAWGKSLINFNSIDSTVLTARHFELIQQWKIENGGSISDFNDMAHIDGIDQKIVENLREFCASKIANDAAPGLEKQTFNNEHAEYVPVPDYFPNDCVDSGNNFIIYDERIPPIDLAIQNDNRHYASDSKPKPTKAIKLALEPKLNWQTTSIESFTSIHQEANGISVARFSANNHNWNDIKVDAWTHYKTEALDVKSKLCQMYEQLAAIVGELPNSDVFIVDDHIKAQRFHKSVSPKKLTEIVHINQQCAILMALLHQKRISNNESNVVFFMGYQAVGQLFNLLVGNEPISTQSTIKKILHGDFSSETLKPLESFKIDVDDEIKRAYHKSYAIQREYLGRSMLIGITFIRLGILRAKTISSKITWSRAKYPLSGLNPSNNLNFNTDFKLHWTMLNFSIK